VTNLRYFPDDGSAQWLWRVDAQVAAMLLALSPVDAVLEVGVWKGAWASVVLMQRPEMHLVGIDPYPGNEAARAIMEARMTRLGLGARFTLHDSWDGLDDARRFGLIHVDGDHAEAAVAADLDHAARRLAPGGVIVADDHLTFGLPGVAAAMHRFCHRSGFRPFLHTPRKAYLAHGEHADEWYDRCRERLPGEPALRRHVHGTVDAPALAAARVASPGDDPAATFDGHPVLLVVPPMPPPLSRSARARRLAGRARRAALGRLRW